jgi:hypothetical protein
MPKILLIGGSRDGEWIEDPGLPYYRVPLPLKTIQHYKADDYDDIFQASYRTENYHRIPFHFREGQKFNVYALDGPEGYQVFDLLLRHYKPKPAKQELPKTYEPEDPEVTKRKAEDKLAAAAWNAFMAQPIPKQK